MNIFHRRYDTIERRESKDARKEAFKRLKIENLGIRDICALIIAMIQLIAPFAIGIVFIYFLIILFITRVWM